MTDQKEPIKIYEIEQQEDGSVKVATSFTPEEVKSLLSVALTMCLANGYAPASIAHLFQQPQEEVDLADIPEEGFYKA